MSGNDLDPKFYREDGEEYNKNFNFLDIDNFVVFGSVDEEEDGEVNIYIDDREHGWFFKVKDVGDMQIAKYVMSSNNELVPYLKMPTKLERHDATDAIQKGHLSEGTPSKPLIDFIKSHGIDKALPKIPEHLRNGLKTLWSEHRTKFIKSARSGHGR